ncbi:MULTISPECIES: PHP domain-containing protein [Acidithrix]|uniref:Error-prone DNA polymerase n=1 Tax=Acidithrix ferrooxidans TaxID=1280514 RepID=A0A0D8HJ71_9ACTN|nr:MULTISPECIES: PHP domain-containing protein [Acidithrix]KJF17904.1 error-prone DNA polymerase [Acidithrix ferrooxidans]CAG4933993.1 unnamed protein product [Acidithrix sp. C25]
MIDLHTHSRVSDGSASPTEVVELAAAAGLRAIALTDHDRFDGLTQAKARAIELGIEFISGVEVSCHYNEGTMHMLVYFVDAHSSPIAETLIEMQMAREDRNLKILELMNKDGINITFEELSAEGGGVGIGKPHFAALLVKKGVVSTLQEAFDHYLAKGNKYYVEKITLSPKDMIALSLRSGGMPVLAHPFTVEEDRDRLADIIQGWVSDGLAGIEAHYGRYNQEQREFLVGLAEKLDIVATGGSDFHGTYKPDLSVGVGKGDLRVPYRALEQLRLRSENHLSKVY